MTGIDNPEIEIIEMTRRLTRSLLAKLEGKGVQPVDAALGVAYALHDAAQDIAGSPTAGVEWMRATIDMLEKGARDARPN